ncbi:biotin/lipoyl attachment domain-containing protein [Fibrella aestuarina BUZ 2]|uniref:Biotin/lipoyl attachment domain-containing protein n=1 Tax=Fibrella aestuarina BUZ 2 TaxID=1166018 RepID=I0K6P6_9BACT|nr:biotin/lipoyl-containing protein [Fibrella aestuarina]CCG99799.1 biotin/lipoyl attachment domain-containing protein [Fibrella aestuarina BUZ 2]
MYTASVNNADPVRINLSPAGITLNDEPVNWDLSKLGERTYHIIRDHQSYSVEVLAIDATTKTVRLKINGNVHEVQVKDRFDLLLEKMGMSNAAASKVNDIKAPMPGLIVGISVQPGDTVSKGDTVLILEAMKMENVIKAPGDGTVQAIKVEKGARVEKGQVLVLF